MQWEYCNYLVKVSAFRIMILQNENVMRTGRVDLTPHSYRAMVHIRYFVNVIPGAQCDRLPRDCVAKLVLI